MQTLMRTLATGCLVLASPVTRAQDCAPEGESNTRPAFDAALLREGRFTYHTTLKGESLGDTVIEIRRAGANYRITMSAPKIAQSWEAVVRRSFAPVSVHLKMSSRGAPYEMSLTYEGEVISGEERKGESTAPVRASARGIVIDQRVDWASIMALQPGSGSSLAVSVFDPSTGFSPMRGKIGTTPSMTGAWGTASAVRLDYRICKREHVESYPVFATQATPRMMLREDMPNGLVSELVAIEP